MTIFRSLTFYLALAGLVLTGALIKKISTEDPQPVHLPPAVNPYKMTIAASGIIEAVDKNIEIGVPQSGLVKEVYVNVGDLVQPDQLLFRLDDRELIAQLLVQNAHLSVLKANVTRLQDQLHRIESVEDPRAISQEELNIRRHDVMVAQAELEASEAQLTQTILLIERLHICAPLVGTILQNNIRKGEFVEAGKKPAIILGDIERLQVRADIDEQHASSIFPHISGTAFPKHNSSVAIPLHFERIEPYVIPKKSLTGAGDERVDTRVLQVIYSFEKHPSHPLYVGQQVDIFFDRSEDSETMMQDQEIPPNAS